MCVEALLPVFIWMDMSRETNMELGSVREVRTRGYHWASSAQKMLVEVKRPYKMAQTESM